MAIEPSCMLVGRERVPVIVADGFDFPVADIVEMAAAMTPFPPAGGIYPGLRRRITARDSAAHAYVQRLMRSISPTIREVHKTAGFFLDAAGFSIVTTPEAELDPRQCVPHFDEFGPEWLAGIHYLTETGGTGFFRHRASGMELATKERVDVLKDTAAQWGAGAGFIQGSNAHFEMTGHVPGKVGRIALWPARLLHSGLISENHSGSADPRVGRLTMTIMIRLAGA